MEESKGFKNESDSQDRDGEFASRNQYSGSGDFSPDQENPESEDIDLEGNIGLDSINHPKRIPKIMLISQMIMMERKKNRIIIKIIKLPVGSFIYAAKLLAAWVWHLSKLPHLFRQYPEQDEVCKRFQKNLKAREKLQEKFRKQYPVPDEPSSESV